MCFHRRLVFTCSHHAWLNLTKACDTEASFERGNTDTGCSIRWSHGYDTIRVQDKCAKCAGTQQGDSYRFGVVKDQIQALKEHLKLIKGDRQIKEEAWLSGEVEPGRSGEEDGGEGDRDEKGQDAGGSLSSFSFSPGGTGRLSGGTMVGEEEYLIKINSEQQQ
ncbi:uncharacterized protein C8A04DRAFT_13066 [Dichotomopilus funicola]|uniref:Uncharacterized protein n=1 Tax=Dichotomopilus funicola TaxID=1934379 RepID=A0AAN6V195_9PEZI|nr:hypothetical protein C8A04DRAFT_13066 [Dichotomopilus funicola]